MVLFLSKAKYVFDTNVFINMQRHYPVDVLPSLWEKISAFIEDGLVVSCDEVFDELSIADDAMKEWAKQRKKAFIASGMDVQHLVRTILTTHSELLTGTKKANGADPFVIAHAKLKGRILVSDETRAGNGQPPKIPNVCEAYGVQVIKFMEFMRREHIQL